MKNAKLMTSLVLLSDLSSLTQFLCGRNKDKIQFSVVSYTGFMQKNMFLKIDSIQLPNSNTALYWILLVIHNF